MTGVLKVYHVLLFTLFNYSYEYPRTCSFENIFFIELIVYFASPWPRTSFPHIAYFLKFENVHMFSNWIYKWWKAWLENNEKLIKIESEKETLGGTNFVANRARHIFFNFLSCFLYLFLVFHFILHRRPYFGIFFFFISYTTLRKMY